MNHGTGGYNSSTLTSMLQAAPNDPISISVGKINVYMDWTTPAGHCKEHFTFQHKEQIAMPWLNHVLFLKQLYCLSTLSHLGLQRAGCSFLCVGMGWWGSFCSSLAIAITGVKENKYSEAKSQQGELKTRVNLGIAFPWWCQLKFWKSRCLDNRAIHLAMDMNPTHSTEASGWGWGMGRDFFDCKHRTRTRLNKSFGMPLKRTSLWNRFNFAFPFTPPRGSHR